MKSSNIGRNDPCPCGSGKKYKRCCYNKPNKIQSKEYRTKEHFLPPYNEIDYGIPIIDEKIFKNHQVHELSAQRLLYSQLLMSELGKFVSKKLNKLIIRSRDERKLIKKTNDVLSLINIMSNNPDCLNHEILKSKILKEKDKAIPLIFEELKKNKKTSFY